MKGVYIFAGVLIVVSSFVFVIMWLAKMGQKMFNGKGKGDSDKGS